MRYIEGSERVGGTSSSSLYSRLLAMIFREPTVDRRNVNPLYLPVSGPRITILSQQKIRAEYDLVRRRWLSREEALSSREYSKTLSKFSRYHGLELNSPRYTQSPTEYVIADLHLGHENIIRYCARPFSRKNVEEMDEVLIRNWNYCVISTDRVYFLGDLAFGERSAMEYRKRLNGSIIHIRGNHDSGVPDARKELMLHSSGIDFRLVHDPKEIDRSLNFDSWTIRDHTHNNDLKRYSFFDPFNKKINVSAEVIGYQPVSIPFLADLIRTRTDRIATIWDC